jgi:hypothetical protein
MIIKQKNKNTIVESFTLFSIVHSIFEGGGLEQCKLSCHSCHIFPNFKNHVIHLCKSNWEYLMEIYLNPI